MKYSSIFIAIILSLFCNGLTAQDSSSLGSGKFRTYAENSKEYEKKFTAIFEADSVRAFAELAKLKYLAIENNDKELELQTEFISIRRNQTGKLSTEKSIKAIEDFKRILKEAHKYRLPRVQLRALYWITELYEVDLHKPEIAAEYFKQVEKLIPLVTPQEFSDKGLLAYKVGENYYLFKDYERAIPYFRMAIENLGENDRRNNINNSARNTIGLCYIQMEQPDSALIWFGSILQQSDPTHIWEAIAKANMGKVYHLRGEYGKAVPLLEFGREKTIAIEQDYGFAAGCCVELADIYLRKKDLPQSRYYIDLAKEYIRKSEREFPAQLYSVESRYYSYVGQPEKASALLDSVLHVKTEQEQRYNALLLMRVEQKEAAQKQQQKEEELSIEKIKRHNAQKTVVIISVAFTVICGLLVLVYFLYRQKRKAYHTLVQRIQQWAEVATECQPLYLPQSEPVDVVYEEIGAEPKTGTSAVEPDDTDRFLFDKLQQLIQTEKIYRNPGITLEEIARLLEINRTYLSQAVNRCSGKNFNAFINEYRIMEAVRLMSGDAKKLSLEGVAIEAGFNDRKTFYTAFKKTTGLSPSEFRNNLQKE